MNKPCPARKGLRVPCIFSSDVAAAILISNHVFNDITTIAYIKPQPLPEGPREGERERERERKRELYQELSVMYIGTLHEGGKEDTCA
jgi:hypothetical protein